MVEKWSLLLTEYHPSCTCSQRVFRSDDDPSNGVRSHSHQRRKRYRLTNSRGGHTRRGNYELHLEKLSRDCEVKTVKVMSWVDGVMIKDLRTYWTKLTEGKGAGEASTSLLPASNSDRGKMRLESFILRIDRGCGCWMKTIQEPMLRSRKSDSAPPLFIPLFISNAHWWTISCGAG